MDYTEEDVAFFAQGSEFQGGVNKVKMDVDRDGVQICLEVSDNSLQTLVDKGFIESVGFVQSGIPEDKVTLGQIDLAKTKSKHQAMFGFSLVALAFAVIVAILVAGAKQ